MALTVTEADAVNKAAQLLADHAYKTLAAGINGKRIAHLWERVQGPAQTIDQALGELAELAGWTTPPDIADPYVVRVCWCEAVRFVFTPDHAVNTIERLERAHETLSKRIDLPSYRDSLISAANGRED